MAENLWALREQKKVSVATLANRAGLPIGLIIEYESGQRSIDPRHLGRLARALYIEESQIRLQSEPKPDLAGPDRGAAPRPAPREMWGPSAPRPGTESLPRVTARQVGSAAPEVRRMPRSRAEPLPPGPARPSQIVALEHLLKRLAREQAAVEAELGKPLADLNRVEASGLLRKLQEEIHSTGVPHRRRAYLPESVEEFESRYLAAAREAGDRLHFTFYDARTVDGQVLGFGPYTITVQTADGSELTLYKLALVSYRKASAAAADETDPAARGPELAR